MASMELKRDQRQSQELDRLMKQAARTSIRRRDVDYYGSNLHSGVQITNSSTNVPT